MGKLEPNNHEAAKKALEEYVKYESYIALEYLADRYIRSSDYEGLIRECKEAEERMINYRKRINSIRDHDKQEGLEFALYHCKEYWDKISSMIKIYRGSLDLNSQLIIAGMIGGTLPWILAWFKVIEFKELDKE